jgi:hypothetical protein
MDVAEFLNAYAPRWNEGKTFVIAHTPNLLTDTTERRLYIFRYIPSSDVLGVADYWTQSGAQIAHLDDGPDTDELSAYLRAVLPGAVVLRSTCLCCQGNLIQYNLCELCGALGDEHYTACPDGIADRWQRARATNEYWTGAKYAQANALRDATQMPDDAFTLGYVRARAGAIVV